MTTEIEKMYINAGIEKQASYYCSFEYGAACPYDNVTCPECPYYKEEDEPQYPDFTAEKQLELIKWLAIRFNPDYMTYWHNGIKDVWIFRLHDLTEFSSEEPYVYESRNKNFAEALCNLINDLWQSLPEQAKKEIRRILE